MECNTAIEACVTSACVLGDEGCRCRDEAIIEDVRYVYENLTKHSYQAVNLFYGRDEKLYLVATHQRWMDTYRFELRVTNDVSSEVYLHLDKIADAQYPLKTLTYEKLFFNGTAIQKLGPRKMRFWCSPWDYRFRLCFAPKGPDAEAKCTYLWHFEREF